MIKRLSRTCLPMLVLPLILVACGDEPAPKMAAAPPIHQDTQQDTASTTTPETFAKPTEPGHKVLAKAKADGKFFVALFTNKDGRATREQEASFDAASNAAGERARFIRIDLSTPGQSHIKKALDLGRSPMPAVVAVAPTGVITKTLVDEWDADAIAEAFVGPGIQAMLKTLQSSKLAVILLQPKDATDRDAARAGFDALFDEDRDGHEDDCGNLVAIEVDPRNKADLDLCARVNVDPKTKVSTTVVLAPPNKELGRIVGATTVKSLLDITRRYKAP